MGEISLLNINQYSSYFLSKNKELDIKYDRASTDYNYYDKVAELGGNNLLVDTPLEIALLSYSAGVIDIRPAEAEAVLPKNDPKLSGLKLGSALYKELTEIKFLDPNNTAAIGRYEGMLKFIQDKSNVTRAEIETYYRNGIRSVIAEAVDEEFNCVAFYVKTNTDGANAKLAYKNGQYILICDGYWDNPKKEDIKTFSAPSLDALVTIMVNSGNFSIPQSTKEVREQAAKFPAVIYASWKPNGVNALDLITETITNFYVNPDTNNYKALVGIAARYRLNGGLSTGTFEYLAWESFSHTLRALFPALSEKVNLEVLRSNNAPALAAYPNDKRFEVFSARR